MEASLPFLAAAKPPSRSHPSSSESALLPPPFPHPPSLLSPLGATARASAAVPAAWSHSSPATSPPLYPHFPAALPTPSGPRRSPPEPVRRSSRPAPPARSGDRERSPEPPCSFLVPASGHAANDRRHLQVTPPDPSRPLFLSPVLPSSLSLPHPFSLSPRTAPPQELPSSPGLATTGNGSGRTRSARIWSGPLPPRLASPAPLAGEPTTAAAMSLFGTSRAQPPARVDRGPASPAARSSRPASNLSSQPACQASPPTGPRPMFR
ncbi:vegetative cell wall protein gp1-like [Triticum aestivum]|uniref:vegetative cell wall protein gp1-like n=1 Tax=Triticum aestivum TaxID=4565 RepID=UPI001D01DDF8|nr:vegetative cell wall protein gp1-like [Triticum aestivum]